MSNKTGSVAKNSTYLATLKTRVEVDRSHPIHHGIKMQAHHIISAEGVKQSGIGPKLVKLGYNINVSKNLIFLPATLQGACHLEVQPHRGDHLAASDSSPTRPDRENEHSYDDDDHPRSYHDLVRKRLMALVPSLDRACEGKRETETIAQSKLDGLSKEIALLICERPSQARLTSIADSFAAGHSTGCAGVDSVPRHAISKSKCPVSRNHNNRQGPNQRTEKISFESKDRYIPQPGK